MIDEVENNKMDKLNDIQEMILKPYTKNDKFEYYY